jgi:hypothetical protein
VKPAGSSGICTISNRSNGARQDWLVCPIRAFSPLLLETAAACLFRGGDIRVARRPEEPNLLVIPAVSLAHANFRGEVTARLQANGACVAYLQDKLGGEISVARTPRSPELSFDITMVELVLKDAKPSVGRFGILEVQTMDFHGSYRAVVKNLEDALRLHDSAFHRTLGENQQWLGQAIEGPNIANVFKRTFYQIMLKFQIGSSAGCAGCVLAIPKSVWDSWQRHLGKPELSESAGGLYVLQKGSEHVDLSASKTWVLVFDIEAGAAENPNPIVLDRIIAASAEALRYYALEVAPAAAVANDGPVARLPELITLRLARFWPELLSGMSTNSSRKPRRHP